MLYSQINENNCAQDSTCDLFFLSWGIIVTIILKNLIQCFTQ